MTRWLSSLEAPRAFARVRQLLLRVGRPAHGIARSLCPKRADATAIVGQVGLAPLTAIAR